MAACSVCAYENPDGARFCNQCGTQIQASPAAAGGAERRQITVVFSDLSGFTAMSENLDPEDVQSVMSEIFTAATRIVTKFGGRVDKLIGDAVMAVYGDPIAHEDDAERAIRATMEIHTAVDALSPRIEPRIGRPLIMHSGINTGVVVTSSGSMDTADTGPLGDTINLAARLEDLSEAGEILLGPETAELVRGVFELADHGSHDLKGKSGPVDVVRVDGLKANRGRPSRRQGEFVGRHEELGILMAAVEKVQDGERTVVGLKAEAGAGKTRLLDEFHRRVQDRVQWLEGRAYAYGENIPYAALVDLVSNAVDINEDDTQQSIAAKLHDGIEGLVDDLERILDPFHRLYGLPVRDGAGMDKESFAPRLLESVTAVVEGLCARAPTVLVFQDLHWADPSSVAVISALATDMRNPVVVVANYRPAFEGSLPNLREIVLGPLSPRQSTELISSLLDTSEPPAELIDFVVERTDGNPFYLEEIINSLIETRALVAADGSWEVHGSLAEADVPTSIRGVIAARIDRLDTDRKRVLREASVVGREFMYEVIKRVATETDTLDPSLADLESADLIRERHDEADLEYFFKHALTQDVAYEGLLKPERTRLHARAAAAIEQQFAGRLEEVTETLAFHYSEGAVIDKAAQYLRRAGAKAMDRYALVESAAHFEKAYALLSEAPPGDEIDRALVETILDWSILFYYRALLPDLDKLMETHQDVLERVGDDRLTMWWLIWRGHARGFIVDHRDVLDYLDRAQALAEALEDDDALAYIRTWECWALLLRGRTLDGIEVARDNIPYITSIRAREPYPYLKTLGMLAMAYATAGDQARSEATSRESIDFGQEVGNKRSSAMGLQMLGMRGLLSMSWDSARSYGDQACAVATDPVYLESARSSWGMTAATIGDNELLSSLVSDLDAALETGVRLIIPFAIDLLRAINELSGPEPAQAFEKLLGIEEEALAYDRRLEALYIAVFTGIVFARVTTGEAQADWRTLVRNPRVLRYVRQAKRESRPRLEALLERLGSEWAGFAPMVHFELAKLLIHQRDKQAAAQHLRTALELIEPLGETEGSKRVQDLLRTI